MTAPIAHRLRSYTATLQRTASSHHAALGGQTGKGTPQCANTMHARRCCITSPALQPLHQRTVPLPRLFPPTFPALLPRLRQPCHFINTARPSKPVCTKLSQHALAYAASVGSFLRYAPPQIFAGTNITQRLLPVGKGEPQVTPIQAASRTLPQRRRHWDRRGALHVAGCQAAHEGQPRHLDAGSRGLPFAVHLEPPLRALRFRG